MSFSFRHAICNEVFEKRPLAAVCREVRQIGYSGIEIAPFTLAEKPADLSPATRRECRDVIKSEGLEFVGLHWLMVSPPGLHVTTPDLALRERSWGHIRELIDLCADLGEDGVMVFGSPKQRSTTGGITPEQATRYFVEELAHVAPHAEARGITILVEALPRNQSDVINTLAEAHAIADEIGSPAVATMFDTHNAVDETEPHARVVERCFDAIRHIHVNEVDGRYPGTGNYDFREILSVLRRLDYRGWISLEVFDFSAGASNIAAASLEFLRREASSLQI